MNKIEVLDKIEEIKNDLKSHSKEGDDFCYAPILAEAMGEDYAYIHEETAEIILEWMERVVRGMK